MLTVSPLQQTGNTHHTHQKKGYHMYNNEAPIMEIWEV